MKKKIQKTLNLVFDVIVQPHKHTFFNSDSIEYGPKDTTSSQLQTHCHYVFNLGFTLIYRRKVVPTICFTKKMLKLLAEKRKQNYYYYYYYLQLH